jgi:hypothetical protein
MPHVAALRQANALVEPDIYVVCSNNTAFIPAHAQYNNELFRRFQTPNSAYCQEHTMCHADFLTRKPYKAF